MRLRPGMAGDMGWMLQQAARGAWEQLTPWERRAAEFPTIARRVEAMARMALAQPGGGFLVAERGGQPLGYALYYLQPNPFTGIPEGVIADLHVVEGARRQGVAGALLRSAEEHLRGQGARGCAAVVALHQQPALRLLTGAGYWPERALVTRPFG
ncbi:MAG: GNAT family N-acetyltransferase [Bacillota bacterium]